MNLLDQIDIVLMVKSMTFAFSALLGMIYAYYRKWSESDLMISVWTYMFGNPHAIGRALTTLIALCVGAGGLDYLEPLSLNQIFLAGAGIGLLVPQTVENRKKNDNRNAIAKASPHTD